MATAGGTNKSAFLRDLLGKNPDLNLGQATEAWHEAGNEGEVGSSLFYNVRRQLQGGTAPEVEATRKPKAKAAAQGAKFKRVDRPVDPARTEPDKIAAAGTAVRQPTSGGRERLLDRMEDRIDDLIGELKQMGGLEDALEALRKARRVVVRSHEG
ncbi:MAG: hypothetical protein BGO49_23140 [Planctomycetales bacterium 71-10]|nr:MAG: hypothetical protein BGO49_23140 [Planctomycetales bacterium 71-10]